MSSQFSGYHHQCIITACAIIQVLWGHEGQGGGVPMKAGKASQRREHLSWASARVLRSSLKIKCYHSRLFHSRGLTVGVLHTKN